MRRAGLVMLMLGCGLSGCSSRYRRANELAKEGHFVKAAEMFEQLVREKPEDKELLQLLNSSSSSSSSSKEAPGTLPTAACEPRRWAFEEAAPQAPGGKVTKSREVKRERKPYQEVVVPKTRFRNVPRTFSYEALRVDRQLRFATRAELRIGGQLAASAGQEGEDDQHGYMHDITFEAANIRPSRPNFSSAEQWLSSQAQTLAARAPNLVSAGGGLQGWGYTSKPRGPCSASPSFLRTSYG